MLIVFLFTYVIQLSHLLGLKLIRCHLWWSMDVHRVLASEVVVVLVEILEWVLRVLVFFVTHITIAQPGIVSKLHLLQFDQRVITTFALLSFWAHE